LLPKFYNKVTSSRAEKKGSYQRQFNGPQTPRAYVAQ